MTVTALAAEMQTGPWAVDVTVDAPVASLPVELRSVTHDSRRVSPGALFCCIPGSVHDGHRHAREAIDSGAAALLVERPQRVEPAVPQLIVADGRRAMAPAAAAVYGHPAGALEMFGVTGTNGKTTTVAILRTILEAAGRRAEAVGTLTQARTTPEAPDLQGLLAGFRAAGVTAVAMEVSSHALVLHRVDGMRFSVAIFTNLSQDHLDFHGTMTAYFRAKAELFEPRRCEAAVVNADEPHGRLLLDAATVPTRPFRMSDAEDLVLGATASRFRWRGAAVELHLGGSFNVANALAAATAAELRGISTSDIVAGLSAVRPVPGRFEPVDVGQAFRVIVDYAHTPDGLRRVLDSARSAAGGHRLIAVFGCGGDRDATKRPAMGELAADLADVAVLTSDNPRSEDPLKIIAEVEAGVRRREALVVEPDRRSAIALALARAEPGDVVVVAGKGHEIGQEIAGVVLPFDDREVVRELLEAAR